MVQVWLQESKLDLHCKCNRTCFLKYFCCIISMYHENKKICVYRNYNFLLHFGWIPSSNHSMDQDYLYKVWHFCPVCPHNFTKPPDYYPRLGFHSAYGLACEIFPCTQWRGRSYHRYWILRAFCNMYIHLRVSEFTGLDYWTDLSP